MKSSSHPLFFRSTCSLAFALLLPLIGNTAVAGAIVGDADFNKTVTVVFHGPTATVTDDDGAGVTVSTSGSSAVAITSTASGVQYVLSGTTNGGYLELTSANSAKVILDGVNLASPDGPAVSVLTSEATYLVLADGKSNTLADPTSSSRTAQGTIHTGGKLLISGTGSLQITSLRGLGIYAASDIRILDGSITVIAPTKDSVHSKSPLQLEGGNLTLTATSENIGTPEHTANDGRAVSALAAAAPLVAPTVTSAPTSDNTTPTLTGTAGASTSVNIKVDGTSAGTVTATTAGFWSFTLPALAAGTHTIVITATDADGNSSTSTFIQTIIATNFTAPKPYGYAASVTGGTGGARVVVSTTEEFVKYASSSGYYVITVVGRLDIGTVAINSSKTIQGFDASATLDGCLRLDAVGNVIIRGLNLVNPDGHALQITNSQLVFVTQCTFLDCAGAQVAVTYSDLLTFSWCEFAATVPGQPAMKLGREAGTDTPRITLHNNWWSTGLGSALPAAETGYVHQFSDYIASAGNTSGTVLSGTAQLLSEKNLYANVANPLTKAGTATIRVIDNVYTNCTGTSAAGADAVFTPGYSYEIMAPTDVATTVSALAGNTAGAAYANLDTGSATITASATTVAPGASCTLTAVPTGVTASTYQWRFSNVPISGATSVTYTISNMSSSTAGKYTVAIGVADGSTVVSTPTTLTLGTSTSDDGDKGGGGSCGLLFPALFVVFALRRRSA